MLTHALQQGQLFMSQKLEQNYGKSNIGYNDLIICYGNYESDKRFEIVISHSFKRELSLHFINSPLLKLTNNNNNNIIIVIIWCNLIDLFNFNYKICKK